MSNCNYGMDRVIAMRKKRAEYPVDGFAAGWEEAVKLVEQAENGEGSDEKGEGEGEE